METVETAGGVVAQDDPTGRTWTWQEGDCTVYRAAARSAPGCHANCGLLVYVKDGRVDHVEGDPENPYNQGRLCARCLAVTETIYHKDRLLHPLKRDPKDRGKNAFRRIGWDEAYDLIEKEFTRIMDEDGPQAIYSMMGTGRDANGYDTLAAAYLGTPTSGEAFLSGNACYIPRLYACFLKLGFYPMPDYSQFWADRFDNPEWVRPDVILVWGNNPTVANACGVLGHWIVDCQKRGSELVTIDPRLTWHAAKSKVWLPVRPGTDGALALALGNQIILDGNQDREFIDCWTYGYEEYAQSVGEWPVARAAEVCGIDESQIVAAARLIGTAERVALQWGVALDQARNGMMNIAAVLDLMALTGNIEKPGTNVQANPEPFSVPGVPSPNAWAQALGMPEPSWEHRCTAGGLSKTLACNNPDDMLAAMETGKPYPIRGTWIIGANPIACMGAESERVLAALRRMDFNVVNDLFMTPTIMACADVVLPVATFCEKPGIAGQAYRMNLSAMARVIEPLGECRSDQRIIYELGQRFRGKGTRVFETEEDFQDFRLRNSGMTYEELRNRVYAYPPFEYYKHEKGHLRPDGNPGFDTPTGRYEFFSLEYHRAGLGGVATYEEPRHSPLATPELLEEYPLVLSTGARTWGFFHSEHRQSPSLRRLRPNPVVQVHPATAERHGLAHGDWAIVENQFGSMRMQVDTSTMVREDTVVADSGWWFPERDPEDGTLFGVFESNSSKLVPFDTGDSGFCADYKAQLCRIYKEDKEGDKR